MKSEQIENLPIEWKRGNGLRKSDLDEAGKNKCILYGELYTKHKNVLINSQSLSKTNKHGKVYSKKGDILVPGTSTAAKKDMLLAREVNEDGILLGGDINIIRPKQGLFAKKYLPYYFMTRMAYQQLDRYITGATGIIHISNKGLKKLKVPLPTLQEQQNIIIILDKAFAAIDSARANAEQNLQNAKELFESYLQQVFDNSGDDWVEKTLGDVCSLYQGLAINRKTKHFLVEKSSLPLLRIKDLRNNTAEQFIDENNYPENSLVNKDDIIYTRTGNSLGLVFRGRYGVLHNNSFKIVPDNSLSRNYLFKWLQNPLFKSKIFSLAFKAAQPDITHKAFKLQKIKIPPIKEQGIIVNKLDTLLIETKKLEAIYNQKIADLEELKNSVLQKAFSGQLNTIN